MLITESVVASAKTPTTHRVNGVQPESKKHARQFDSIFEEALWIRYSNSLKNNRQHITLRNQLFNLYADIPKMAAGRYSRTRLPYRSLSDYEDILADANIGLLKCISRYEICKGVKFNTFSYTRVNGAIIDGLRVLQDFPRVISRIRRELDPLINWLTQEINRVPSLDEVARRFPFETICGVEIDEVIKDPLIQSNVFSQGLDSDSDAGFDDVDCSDSIIEYCLQKNSKNRKSESCDSLQRIHVIDRIMDCLAVDKEERTIIYYYFFMNMTSTKIAEVMKVSASNVCIKKTSALNRIRTMLLNDPEFLEELRENS